MKKIILLSATVSMLCFSNGQAQVSFDKKLSIPNIGAPGSIASGDFDEDGDIDMATLNGGTANISVFLNSGNGDMKIHEFISADNGVIMHAYDINNDSHKDLIYISANSIVLLTGTGTGQFASAGTLTVGISPHDFDFGDFDNNGVVDIAVICGDYFAINTVGTLSILIGQGNGVFAPSTDFSLDMYYTPFSIVVGKFNNDLLDDIALTNANDVQGTNTLLNQNKLVVMTNTGSGFQKCYVYEDILTNFHVGHIIKGKFNLDNFFDLAFVDVYNDKLTVLTGTGTGTFDKYLSFGVQDMPEQVATSDLNNDGRLDFITTNYGSGSISVLNGSGGFGLTANYALGNSPFYLVSNDFNSDGSFDAALTDGKNLLLLTNSGAGGLTQAFKIEYHGFTKANTIVGLDPNNDLIVSNYGANNISVLTGTGTGDYYFSRNLTTNYLPAAILTDDFNKDGFEDFAVNGQAAQIAIFTTSGNGLSTSFNVVAETDQQAFNKGDFNKDGYIDLVTTSYVSGVIVILTGTGTGSFNKISQYVDTISGTGKIEVQDFNKDGYLDLIVGSYNTQSFYFFAGTVNGNFNPKVSFTTLDSFNPVDPKAFDFNMDGNLDLLFSQFLNPNNIMVWTGTGTGSFAQARKFSTGTNGEFTMLADINCDDIMDIIQTNKNDDQITILTGTVSGFVQAGTFATAQKPLYATVKDLNKDHKPDIALVGQGKDYYLTTLINTSVFANAPVIRTQPVSQSICGGNLASLNVSVSGLGLSYLWSNGSTTTGISTSIPGSYMVSITGSCGFIVSNVAFVTTIPSTKINFQTPNQTICQGELASMEVSATGNNLIYTWTDNISSVMSAHTTISGLYFVTVSGLCGNVVSDTFAIKSKDLTKIIVQPSNQTICGLNPVTLSVSATGSNLSYLWSNGSVTTNISTSLAGTYMVTVSGFCTEEISNQAMVVTTDTCTITIIYNSKITLPISVYPNPSTGSFTILFYTESNYNVLVFDLYGKVVYSDYTNSLISKTYNLTNLADGMYVLQVSTGGNNFNGKLHIIK